MVLNDKDFFLLISPTAADAYVTALFAESESKLRSTPMIICFTCA